MKEANAMKLVLAVVLAGLLTACAHQPAPVQQPNPRIVERDLSKGAVIIPNPERP